jgi:hypothetical protein
MIPVSRLVESEDFKLEHHASTIDLSVQGMRARIPLPLLPGETVGIITIGDCRHAISTRVVWMHRAGSDLWSFAGLAFLETLPA